MNVYIIHYGSEWGENDRDWAVIASGYQHALEQLNGEIGTNLDFSNFVQDEEYPDTFYYQMSKFIEYYIHFIPTDEPMVLYL